MLLLYRFASLNMLYDCLHFSFPLVVFNQASFRIVDKNRWYCTTPKQALKAVIWIF